MENTGSVAMNQNAVKELGSRLQKLFDSYEKSRYSMESQWMKNLRQYRGVPDPELKVRPNGSEAYPKFTRKWVNGTVSRLMQMLFPQTEHNWDTQPSPIPDLSKNTLQKLLDEMQNAALQSGQPDLSDDQIEKMIKELAQAKCDRMKLKMRDQLSEIDYPAMAKKVVFSGVLYGTGLLSGPLIKKEKHRTWSKGADGRYIVNEADRLVPWFEPESVWDWYPDLTAKNRSGQDGYFFRRVMSREMVRKLAERPDFMATRVVEWLRKNTRGNFKERYWETEVRTEGDRKYAEEINRRKYEVLEWWGFISGHELRACGVEISDAKLSDQFESNVWLLEDTVIKCIMNPMEKKRRPLHEFVFEEDDLSLGGVGLPQIARDSQLAIVEAARMMLDNASTVCTPSKLVKMGLLMPGHPLNTGPYQDWYQDVDATDNSQDAVKNLSFDSHIAELQSIINLFKGIGEEEVSLPPISMGDTSQGGSEGARTQGNLSMLMGAASLPIRDTVRNFDLFTVSAMTALYDWNMEFDSDQKAKGDYKVIARGSTSLMAKEVRAQSFNLLMQTIQPEEREHLDWRKNLTERMKTVDIMPDEILLDEESVKQNAEQRQKMEELTLANQQKMLEAQVNNLVTQALKNQALAKKADISADVQQHEAVLAGVDRVQKTAGEDQDRQQKAAVEIANMADRERELDLREREVATKEKMASKPKGEK